MAHSCSNLTPPSFSAALKGVINVPERKGCHLTFDDRCDIEEMLAEGKSFRAIAKHLDVSPTTVSNEVRLNRDLFLPKRSLVSNTSRCGNFGKCNVTRLCSVCVSRASCCKRCKKVSCIRICPDFEEYECSRLKKAPFVCEKCIKKRYCALMQARYKASSAQSIHDARITDAHSGIAVDADCLASMVSTVKGLLSQGHSLEAIWLVHGDEFPVCVRTFYNYMEKGVMGLANIELPRKVRYAPRKNKREQGAPKCDFSGRTYCDWLALTDEERLLTVQMDTIEGRRCDTQCVLSLHFVRLFFQIYILLPDKTQASVKGALDAVESYCEGEFADCIPIILTDRGSEFLNPELIEMGEGGMRRCRVYYCDPVKPGQKGAAEKNHVEFRRILPKGSDFDALSFSDVSLVCSHVNSYPRAGSRSAPIMAAREILPKKLLESLGIVAIDADSVIMTPKLLK